MCKSFSRAKVRAQLKFVVAVSHVRELAQLHTGDYLVKSSLHFEITERHVSVSPPPERIALKFRVCDGYAAKRPRTKA